MKILKKLREYKKIIAGIVALILGAMILFVYVTSAPSDFPERTLFRVEKNATAGQTAALLKEKNAIRSTVLFKIFLRFGKNHTVIAGDYYLEKPQALYTIVSRVKNGLYGVKPIKVTLLEGYTVSQMGTALKKAIPSFNMGLFLELAKGREGYLFPDTYLFLPNVTPDEVVSVLTANFALKISKIEPEIDRLGKDLRDVVTMASILEEEARTKESKEIISGILWKRLAAGMPLQVDAPFLYVNGKLGRDLTSEDLRVDSPYNTYKYRGLPPTPISNPGYDSLSAAASPTTTPYWFYLSDRKGEMHYAVTHDDHLKNIEKYLR